MSFSNRPPAQPAPAARAQQAASAPAKPAPMPAAAPTPPDPRKLRDRLIFALIETSPTRVARERAPDLIAEAEQLMAYIMTGEVPAPAGKERV